MERLHVESTRAGALAPLRNLLLTALAAAVMFAGGARAQERTLLDIEQIESGGFGGPQVMYTTFNGEHGLLVGGQGAWVINQTVYLGGGGFGLTTRHDAPRDPRYTETPRLQMGYGGAMVGLILRSDDLLHLACDLTVGGGAVSNTVEPAPGDPGYDPDDEMRTLRTIGFWHLQPMVHAELNVTNWMRLALSGGWRIARDFSGFGMTAADLSGPVAGLTFRFGSW